MNNCLGLYQYDIEFKSGRPSYNYQVENLQCIIIDFEHELDFNLDPDFDLDLNLDFAYIYI